VNTILFTKVCKKHNKESFNKEEVAIAIGKEKLTQIYRDMVRTRAFDGKIDELLKRGESITQHATTGQEATPIAGCANLNHGDYVMPYHRGWAWAIGKGMRPDKMLAELLCKKTGYNKGKGGPQLASYEHGVLGRPGIQGAHLSIAAGVGLSIKIRKSDQVCMSFSGNGSSNSGNFYEALNMAAVWKAPVIYIVENNLYEIYEKSEDTTSVSDIADRGVAFGLEGLIVDGNDAIAVYHAVKGAVEKARRGEGPSLIETKTYRWYGHSTNDNSFYGGYRSKEEVDAWKEKCPIAKMKKDLLALKLITSEQIEMIEAGAREEMDQAEIFALNSPSPTREELLTDNYSE